MAGRGGGLRVPRPPPTEDAAQRSVSLKAIAFAVGSTPTVAATIPASSDGLSLIHI